VTALWAAVEQNPWFGEPRSAVADTLGADPARFAAGFGRLGHLAELEQVHRSAGLGEVRGQLVSDEVTAPGAAEHWASLTGRIGHYTRLDTSLTPGQSQQLMQALAAKLEPYRVAGELRMPRRIVLVTARMPSR
jgi:hypothetical protein